MKNTLQSISNHKYNNVLDNFGKADITYGINFKLIEKIVKKLFVDEDLKNKLYFSAINSINWAEFYFN